MQRAQVLGWEVFLEVSLGIPKGGQTGLCMLPPGSKDTFREQAPGSLLSDAHRCPSTVMRVSDTHVIAFSQREHAD